MKTEADKANAFRALLADVEAALSGETDPLIWMAALSCLLTETLGFLWVGFYRVRGDQLLIGPYQGTFGCVRIPFGKGVCGTCAVKQETIIVSDVHEFPGHIACDPNSRSEIVVPVFDLQGELRAVLDVDSDVLDDFSEVDQEYLEQLADKMRGLEWSRLS